jgi:hypothetical protein
MTVTYTVKDFVASMHGAEISAAPGGAVYGLQSLSSTLNPNVSEFDEFTRALLAVPKVEADAEEAKRPKRSAKKR